MTYHCRTVYTRSDIVLWWKYPGTHIRPHMRPHIRPHMHPCDHVLTHMYKHHTPHTHTHTHTYTHTHTHARAHTTHTHAHTYTHTHTHTPCSTHCLLDSEKSQTGAMALCLDCNVSRGLKNNITKRNQYKQGMPCDPVGVAYPITKSALGIMPITKVTVSHHLLLAGGVSIGKSL